MRCRQCNAEIPRRLLEQDSFRCPECGKVYRKRPQPQQQPMQRREPERQGGMVCPQCGSRNVSVQFIQTSANTVGVNSGISFKSGCLGWIWKLFYYCGGFLIHWMWKLCTFWIPRFKFGRKSVSANHTRFKNKKMMVCNNCGYSHEIR